MTAIKSFVKKRPLLIYFTLTFAITWGCMVIVIGPGGFPMTTEQFESLGPLVYLAMLVGPSAAGTLLTGLVEGRAGFRELLSRLLRWRVEARWYAVALLTAPLLATTVLLALSLFSPEFLPALFTSGDWPTLLLSGVGAGLVVGLFEELGWTGFAVPRMRLHNGILTTGIVVGFLWGAWHFLPFWESDTFSGALPFALLLARLFSWLPPYRVLMVWVYDHTESLLVVILMHASLVFSTLALPSMGLSGVSLLTWLLVWAAVLWAIAAAVVVTGGRRFAATAH
jgi:membrane protease YdiL (CAAX protease family)